MSLSRGAILSVLVLALAPIPANASAGSGLVTLKHVGPLRFGRATAADVRAYAGRPNHVTQIQGGQDFFYKLSGGSAQYYIVNGRLHGFETSLERFHTASGTRPGQSVQEAKHHERGARTSSECGAPALLRTRGRKTLGLWITHGHIFELFVLAPGDFGFC